MSSSLSWREESPYGRQFGDEAQKGGDDDITATTTLTNINYYNASCYCGRVRYQVRGEPESAKFCHCRGCQQLHGAPFEWVSLKKFGTCLYMHACIYVYCNAYE